MGKKAPSAPPAPDPAATAAAQAAANKETAIAQRALNMFDVESPQGTISYSPTGQMVGDIERYKVTQALSPEQQRLYDLSTQAQQRYGEIGTEQLSRVGDVLGQPFSTAEFGAAPVVNEATRRQVAASMMGRLEPQLDARRAALETRLANQGFVSGSEAYNTAMDENNRAYNDALLAADIAAGGEMRNVYALEAAARDKAINEALMQRTQPLSELAALFSGVAPQAPQFLPGPQGQIGAPDIMGATYANYSGAQNAYNQAAAQQRAETQGLYGLLGQLGGAGLYGWAGRK